MRRLVVILAVALLMLASSAMADTFQLQYDTVFSGATPAGSAPWLLATFTDTATGVDLSVSAFNLSGSEFVGKLYFNNINYPTTLGHTFDGSSTAPTPGFDQGLDSYKADGDGWYDIRFTFPTNGSDRFTNGEIFNATLTGTGLTAASFNSLSSPGGGAGTWLAAAHIQGTPANALGETSGWVAGTPNTVPEPVSTVLFLVGGATLAIRRYRKNVK